MAEQATRDLALARVPVRALLAQQSGAGRVGLIRKSLAVSTLGVVRPSSKKQRVAKQTLTAARASARADAQTATAATAAQQQAELLNRHLAQQAAVEHQFRYDTDSTYRARVEEKQGRTSVLEAQAADPAGVEPGATPRPSALVVIPPAWQKGDQPWQEGDRVMVVDQWAFRSERGVVLRRGRTGVKVRLDSGTTTTFLDHKLGREP